MVLKSDDDDDGVCVEREGSLFLRNWLTRLQRLGESKDGWGKWAGWRLWEQLQFEFKGILLEEFLIA